ncbi:DNA methyltransferase [Halobacteriales archaeon SW_7_71_33]|nr:MAG: DNA methyltransferase [Halobacteriales archaeon SW_7_71_33]
MTDPARWRCLDLFAGLGGFSSAFAESEVWAVTTVDIEERFKPDICADVFDLRPSDLGEYDVVLASPPCPEFSPAQNLNGKHDPDEDAIALVHHAIGLAKGIKPEYWVLENPRGRLRSYIGRPETTVTYCQYGQERMKPTDLWGQHPTAFVSQRCDYGDGCHINHRSGSNAQRDELGMKTAAARSKVPHGLSEAIREACETGLRGEAREQATLAEVTNGD